MENNAFKTFMGNQVWDLENVFDFIDVRKEFGNHKYIVQREFELNKEFTTSKMTALLCELLYEKGSINFNFIKDNYDTLNQISKNTVNQFEMIGKQDVLSEYLGGAINLSVARKGYMYEYKTEADSTDKGLNETYMSLAKELQERTNYPLTDCNKIMFFTWLLFDCNILEIGANAMKLVLKETFNRL